MTLALLLLVVAAGDKAPMAPTKTQVEAMNVLFEGACRSREAWGKAHAPKPGDLPALSTDGAQGPTIEFLERMNRLAISDMAFTSEEARLEWGRQLEASRRRFMEDFWAHVTLGSFTRKTLQQAIDALPLFSGSFEELQAPAHDACGLTRDVRYRLLVELRTPSR